MLGGGPEPPFKATLTTLLQVVAFEMDGITADPDCLPNHEAFRVEALSLAHLVTPTSSPGPGRRKYAIPANWIQHLLGEGCSITEMAALFGVHRDTMSARMREAGLCKMTQVPDEALREHVLLIQREGGNAYTGTRAIHDILRNRYHIRVPMQRVADICREEDPVGFYCHHC